MPTDRLDKDIQMMRDANITVVRAGESIYRILKEDKLALTLIQWLHQCR